MVNLGEGPWPIDVWIRDEKYLFSKRVGYDVGVPATVDQLIARAGNLRNYGSVSDDSPCKEMDKHLFTDAMRGTIAPREAWISSYFFRSPLCYDEDGLNPLIGELKRFEARKRQIPVSDVSLNGQIVRDYSFANGLSEIFQNMALGKLGFGKPIS